MYIHTESREQLERSVCMLLNITSNALYTVFADCYREFQKDCEIFILDDQYDYFKRFVKEHLRQEINQIFFYHLSRRLLVDDDLNGYNFVEVLTADTTLSNFLKKHHITYNYVNHLQMFIHHKNILADQHDDNYADTYLKQRFGYWYQDFGIKGFAFGDTLQANEFYHTAASGPEFLNYFFTVMDADSLLEEYYQASTYYRFEYLVPLDLVYFEEYDDLSYQEKQYHILIKAMQRLYNYQYGQLWNDCDNPIISMKNNQTLSKLYFVKKVILDEYPI